MNKGGTNMKEYITSALILFGMGEGERKERSDND